MSSSADLAFLGISGRVEGFRFDDEEDWTYHILGLRQALRLPIFPVDLRDQFLVFAIRNAKNLKPSHVSIVNAEGSEVLGVDLDVNQSLVQDLLFPSGAGSTSDVIWQILTLNISRRICMRS